MITIPEELLEQVERGNVLLFIGERVVRDAEGQAVIDRLTTQLAERVEISESVAFQEAAQAYEDEMGRQALIRFLRDQLGALGDEPQKVHVLIAGLKDCDVLATTAIDARLERALEQTERKLDILIGNEEVAYTDEGNTQLYKLRGTVERPDSLVLTEDDYEAFFENQASILMVLQGYLATKTIVFVGYDLADPSFRQLYRKVKAPLDDHARRAYAFGEAPSRMVAAWCKRSGIKVIEEDVTSFLETLTERLDTLTRPTRAIPAAAGLDAGEPLPERPYKLLDYYESTDAANFFGRGQETWVLSSMIHAHRLVLLYGDSGVGKTSLLLAGAVPRLESAQPSYEVLYVRALEDPTLAVRRAVRRRLPDVDLPAEAALADFLDAAAKAFGRAIVIVFDQFEEFFIHLNPELRAEFIAELVQVYYTHELPVKVVLSLREDWLASVSEIEKRIPEVIHTRMRLLALTREQAHQAITGPVEKLGVRYEPDLVNRLLDDLTYEGVMPPQLQLVCSALYDARGEGQLITLATYERLGEAKGVLQAYLDDALRVLGPEQMLARSILEELVTSKRTKSVRTAGELARDLQVDENELAPLLERLVAHRLVRPVETADRGRAFELAHEYLIRDIEFSPEAQSRKEAQEIIAQELDNYRRRGWLLRRDQLELVNDVRELFHPSAEAQEFLLRSALEHNVNVEYWLTRLEDPDRRQEVLADVAKSERPSLRRRAAIALGSVNEPASAQPLVQLAVTDQDASVRAEARASLETLTGQQRDLAVEQLIDLATTPDRAQAARAREALCTFPLTALALRLRVRVLGTRLRVWIQTAAHWIWGHPVRRLMAFATALLLLLFALVYTYAFSHYFLHIEAPANDDPQMIVVKRGYPGLPLPGLGGIVAETSASIDYLTPEGERKILGSELRSLWWQNAESGDYPRWQQDLLESLARFPAARMYWHLGQPERTFDITWELMEDDETRSDALLILRDVIALHPDLASSDVLSRTQAAIQDHRQDPSVQQLGLEVLKVIAISSEDLTLEAIDHIVTNVADAEPNASVNASSMLIELVNAKPQTAPDVAEVLTRLLQTSVGNTGNLAARVLEQVVAIDATAATREAAEALVPLMKLGYWGTQLQAAEALGAVVAANHRAATPVVTEALIELLTHDDWSVRDVAASALGQIAQSSLEMATPQVAEALATPLTHPNDDVRSRAVNIVEQMVTTNLEAAPQIAQALTARLGRGDQNTRLWAAHILTQIAHAAPEIATPQLVDDLLAVLADRSPAVLAQVAATLGEIVAVNPEVSTANAAEALLPLLDHDDPNVRFQATETLGVILAAYPEAVTTPVIEGLVGLLSDYVDSVRSSARAAIQNVVTADAEAAPQLTDALIPLLMGESWQVSTWMSIEMLGLIVDLNPEAATLPVIEAVAAKLRDVNADVRSRAASTLEKVATANPETVSLLTDTLMWTVTAEGYIRISVQDWERLFAIDPEIYQQVRKALVELLTDEWWLRVRAASALEDIIEAQPEAASSDLTQLLIRQLRYHRVEVRQAIASTLQEAALANPSVAPRVVEALLPLLDDESENVQTATASVLGVTAAGYPQLARDVVNAMLPLLEDKAVPLRAEALQALGEIASANPALAPQVLDVLLIRLADEDEDDDVRIYVAAAMGAMAKVVPDLAPKVTRALLTVLMDTESGFPSQAWPAVWELVASQPTAENTFVEMVTANPDIVTSRLVVDVQFFLAASDPGVRARAISVMKTLVSVSPSIAPQLIEAMISLLESESYYVQAAAIAALGDLVAADPETATPQIINILIDGVLHENWDVHMSAASALRKVVAANPNVESQVIDDLISRLEDPDYYVRESATDMLVQVTAIQPGMASYLMEALAKLSTDPDEAVRFTAMSALERAAAVIEEVTMSQASQYLTKLMNDARGDVRRQAVENLEQLVRSNPELASAQLVEQLRQRLGDDEMDVRTSVASALDTAVALNPETATPQVTRDLLNLLSAMDQGLRTNAIAALVEVLAAQLDLAPHLNAIVETLLLSEETDIRHVEATLRALIVADRGLTRPEAATALVESLNSDDSRRLLWAIHLLGYLEGGDAETAPRAAVALAGQLTHKDETVRQTTKAALQAVMAAYPQVVPSVADSILTQLADTENLTAAEMADTLGTIVTDYPQVVPQAIEILHGLLVIQKDEATVAHATKLNVLDGLDQVLTAHPEAATPQTVTALIAMLDDTDLYVRIEAVQALGRSAAVHRELLSQVTGALIALMSDEIGPVRSGAGHSLVRIAGARQEIAPQIVDALMILLDAEDNEERANAMSVLGQIATENEGLVAPIVNALSQLATDIDKDPGMRSEAAFFVVQIAQVFPNKVPGIVEMVTDFVEDSDPETRRRMAESLAKLASVNTELASQAVVPLVRLLADDEYFVREIAAASLSTLLDEPLQTASQATAALLAILDHEDPQLVAGAVSLLGQAVASNPEVGTPEILTTLLRLLSFGNPSQMLVEVRDSSAAALEQLVRSNPELVTNQAVQTLLSMLGFRDGGVRARATYILGRFVGASADAAGPELKEALTALLDDEASYVRSSAAFALGQMGRFNPEFASPAIAELIEMLARTDEMERAAAVNALGEVGRGNPELFDQVAVPLRNLISDKGSTVRSVVASSFAKVAVANPQLAPEVADDLFGLLEDDESDVRASAAAALAEVGAASPALAAHVTDALVHLQSDEGEYVQPSAASGLGKIAAANPAAASQAVESLAQLLASSEKISVRVSALSALERVGTGDPKTASRVVELMAALFADEDVIVRRAVVVHMKEIGLAIPEIAPQVAAGLVRLLTDEESDVRWAASVGLRALITGKPKVISSMMEALRIPLNKGIQARVRLAHVLGRMATQYPETAPELAEALVSELGHPDWRVRLVALSVLSRVLRIDPSAVPPEMAMALIDLLGDQEGELRLRAASLLGQTVGVDQQAATLAAAEGLTRLLEDDESVVRAVAASALGGLAATNPSAASAIGFEALARLFSAEESYVRSGAAYGIGRVGMADPDRAPQAAEFLTGLLIDDALSVRLAAAYALNDLVHANPQVATPQMSEGLVGLLTDEQRHLRVRPVGALAQVYAAQALQPDGAIEPFLAHLDAPLNSSRRCVAGEAHFLAALQNPDYEHSLRTQLMSLVSPCRPPVCIAAKRTLEMLDIAVLANTADGNAAQRDKITSQLQNLRDTEFFGESVPWAAQEALHWLEQKTMADAH